VDSVKPAWTAFAGTMAATQIDSAVGAEAGWRTAVGKHLVHISLMRKPDVEGGTVPNMDNSADVIQDGSLQVCHPEYGS